jgi:hypothetical protein
MLTSELGGPHELSAEADKTELPVFRVFPILP